MRVTLSSCSVHCGECAHEMQFSKTGQGVEIVTCTFKGCKYYGVAFYAPVVEVQPVAAEVPTIGKKSPWPMRDTELLNRGYKFANTGTCGGRRCSAKVEWWTTPSGARMPMVKHADSTDDKPLLLPHFADCVDRAQFS